MPEVSTGDPIIMGSPVDTEGDNQTKAPWDNLLISKVKVQINKIFVHKIVMIFLPIS